MPMPAARMTDKNVKKTDAISVGSPNVITESLPQARVGDILLPCGQPVLKGSASVFVNGMPAARIADPTGCPDMVGEGAAKTFIGDGKGAPNNGRDCFKSAASSGAATISFSGG